MTIIHDWTLQLAETVSPEEVYLAPSIADSYISTLHVTTENSLTADEEGLDSCCEPCGVHLFLPLVLRSVEQASNGLVDLLSSPTTHDVVTNIIPLATLLIQFKECSLHEKSHEQAQRTMNSFVSLEELNQELSEQYPACQVVAEDISETLRESGIPDKVADITAWKTVRQFFKNRQRGLEYLRQLKK